MSRGTVIDLGLSAAYNDLFSTQEERDNAGRSYIVDLPYMEISDFPDHPFKVRMDESMMEMVESVKANGVLVPAMVRPKPEGGYEMVSGHRRKRAAELAELTMLPCIVRDLTDDEAIIIMVDSNLQRETVLPSEKAFAYKMKLDAMKRQAGRPSKENGATVLPHFSGKKSREILAEQSGESHEQIRRYIRLTNLIPPLLDMVDEKRIAFKPAVELSYLNEEEQTYLSDIIGSEEATPSLAQAIKMRDASKNQNLSASVLLSIMQEEKPNQKEKYSFKADRLRQYIPTGYTPKQTEDYVVKALEHYQQFRERQRAKKAREQER